MANLPISGLDVQTTLLDTDLMVVVDTTDHSMAVTGTDKQITAANFIAGVKTALVTVPDTLVPFGDASSDLTTDANFNYATSTLTAPTVKGKSALQVQETGGGTDTISIVAPASIPSSYTITLPDQVGTNGQVFSTSGLGVVTYTSTATAPTVSTIMLRDVNGNAQVNVLGRGVTSTATAAGTTTLLPSSTANQIFTGVTTQTVRLPDVTAANMAIGMQWIITNQSSGTVTVQTNSGLALSPAVALTQNQSAYCTVVSLTNNLATSWVLDFIGTTTGTTVTSFSAGTTGFTPNSATTGAVTLAGTLIVGNGGTGATTLTNHGVLLGQSTSAITATAAGSAGQILQSGGASADPAYSTSTYPATNAVNTLLYASSANVMAALATANNGMLVTSSGGVPSILAGPGTTGNILQSNAAAAPSFSTATYPSSTTINQILYSSAANTVSGLATGNNGVLITSATGVPSLLANGTTGQVLTATTGSPPTWVSPAAGGVTSLNTLTGALTMSQVVAVNDAGSAGGSNSIQIGSSSSASGADAICIGRSSTSSAADTVSIGRSTMVGGGSVSSIAIGTQALNALTSSGTNNFGAGLGAGKLITTGTSSVIIGANALDGSATASSSWVAIGFNAATAAVTTAADGGVAIGHSALNALTSGARNTHVGYNGGNTVATTTGSDNTFLGYGIISGATRSNNTVVGSQATVGNSISGGCAFGAGAAATSADCIAIGRIANAISGSNIAIGPAAQSTNSSSGCIAIGISTVTASGANGIAIGTAATATQSGAIAIGNSADAITGTNGIAIGTNAQSQIGDAIAIGNAATALTGAGAIAIGLSSKSAQAGNVAIGQNAMGTAGGSPASIAIGSSALLALASGNGANVGIGNNCGQTITSGDTNTIIGSGAMAGAATASSACTAVGYSVAGAATLTTGANGFVGVGSQALWRLTSGARNTHVGNNASDTVATTTGSDNTLLGNGITVAATVSNNTIVGSLATAATFGGCSILGKGATATADNQLVLRVGNSATTELVSTLAVTTNVTATIGTNTYLPVTINGVAYKIALFT